MKVGDQVVCINDVFHPIQLRSIPNRPIKDVTYTIRDIRYYDMLDKTGLMLEEISNPHSVTDLFGRPQEPSFNIIRFKAVQKKKSTAVVEEEEEVACL